MARKRRAGDGHNSQKELNLVATATDGSPDTTTLPQDEEARGKDRIELDLEKLVFGDDIGFKENLKLQEQDYSYDQSSEDERPVDLLSWVDPNEDNNLEALADADVR